MKSLLAIFFLTCYALCDSQIHTKRDPANKPVQNAASTKYKPGAAQNLTSPLLHDTCLDKQFSIVFYVVLDSTYGVGQATPLNLSNLIDTINTRFSRICVKFVACSTVFIPNYPFGQKWKKNITEPVVTSNWYTDRTINFYLVDSLHLGYGNTEPEGYTYEPSPQNLASPRRDLMVIEKYKIVQGNGKPVLHLLGHFFGLPDTDDEINPTPTPAPPPFVVSQELADGSNCVTHGDGFCDTEADPGAPFYPNMAQDGMGNFYIFPKDNLMSYYSTRCRFSQQQYNHMARIIATTRLYLH